MRRRSAEDSETGGPESTRAGRLLFGALIAVLVLAPWPWGGNTAIARSLLSLAGGGLMLAWLLSHAAGVIEPPRLTRAALWSLLVWVIWMLWVALQLAPAGPALLRQFSPLALVQHDRLGSVHPAPFYTFSIAPGQTIEGLLDTFTLFCFYCLTLLLVNSRSRIRTLLTAVFVAGLLQALYGIHMTVSGVEYGFFAHKTTGIGWATGTFVNRNHFAAYLELASAAGIGLVLMDLGGGAWGSWRAIVSGAMDLLLSAKFRIRVMMAVLVVGVVLSRSRMGNAALFTAIGLAGMTYMLLRLKNGLIPAMLLFLSLGLIDLWIVSHWFGLEQVMERIAETDIEIEQRPLAFRDMLPAIGDYLATGSGLGTFSSAFSPYRSIEVRGYFDHAHNEYAEFLIETGVVGLGILGLLVAIHLFHALRVMALRRRSVYAGAAFAVLMSSIAMLIHGTVEFMLRMPAVALTWVVLLALGASMQARRSRGRQAESVTSVTQEA